MFQAPVDVRVDIGSALALKTRIEQAVSVALEERTRARRERAELRGDNSRLMSENERLAEENQLLREAAELWISLYERQLQRATRVEAQLIECRNSRG
jgi:hypothetical protein